MRIVDITTSLNNTNNTNETTKVIDVETGKEILDIDEITLNMCRWDNRWEGVLSFKDGSLEGIGINSLVLI